jgi:spore coat polysaccharide biosynthesis protein SpsF
MKIGIIIQARMGSSRFPGKILKKINNISLLELQYRRLINSKKTNKIIIATSNKAIDNCIEELCIELDIPCFRGSENNVLDRYYQAAKSYDIDTIIRSNGDCPFIDFAEIDKLIEIWESNYPKYDYISNILEETFPLGMHIEIFTICALKKALNENLSKEDLEHVTPYLYRNPEKFNLLSVRNKEDLSNYRWTIDYPEDLKFVEEIYKRLGTDNSLFSMKDIINLLQVEPELTKINSKYKKKQNLL